ncbi:MAG: hypothetical protein EXR99_06160 [Gemmataceae bacterium]|nr:hypothetical protein [Gemmataceae bacterium]
MRTDYSMNLPMESGGILTQVFDSSHFRVESEIADIAFLKEQTLLTMEEDGLLREWNLESGLEVCKQEIEPMVPLWRFHPIGRLLGGGTRAVQVFHFQGGNPGWVSAPTPWLTSLAFSSQPGVLASGDVEGWVRLWKIPEKEPLCQAQLSRLEISALAFSPDGGKIAVATEDCQILILDSSNLQHAVKLSGHKDRIPALVWSPDGKTLYSAAWDTTVRVWDTVTGKARMILNTHAVQVRTLALSRDGGKLASADSDFLVRAWDVNTFQECMPAREVSEEVSRLEFSPGGQTLAVAGKHKFEFIRLAKHPGEMVQSRLAQGNSHLEICKGNLLAWLNPGEFLEMWDASLGKKLPPLKDAGPLQAFAFSPSGEQIAASFAISPAGKAGGKTFPALGLWSVADKKLQKIVDNIPSSATSIAYSPKGDLLAWGSVLGDAVQVYDLEADQPLGFFPDAAGGCSITSLAFLSDGSGFIAAGLDWMATSQREGKVICWDVRTRAKKKEWNMGAGFLAVSPGGKYLALARPGSQVEVWDLASWEKSGEIADPHYRVTSLAFRPGGSLLATAGEDQRVRFWAIPGFNHLGTMELEFKVKALAFSPSGNDLFLLAPGGTCGQYDVRQFLDLN